MSKVRRRCPELPVDLVAEILLRLEVKHVLRCKLVSKTVYSLIKSPSFTSQHLHRIRTNKNSDEKNNLVVSVSNKLVYLLSPESQVHLPYDLLSRFNSVFVVGSCNGLLCMLLRSAAKPQLLLCNPATGEHRVVPDSQIYEVKRSNFGFGYDALSGDYKVLKIEDGYETSPYSVKVWSAGTNKWTTNIDTTPLNILLEGRRLLFEYVGLFLFGNLYWVAYPNGYDYNADDGNILFSISLSDYSVHQITIADVTARCFGVNSMDLTVFRGCLAMFVRKISRFDSCYDLWMMEDKDGRVSWAKQLSIGPFASHVRSTSVFLNGNLVMQRLTERGSFFLYDPRTKNEIKLPFPHKAGYCSVLWRVDESLVSLQKSDDLGLHDSRDR